MRKTLHEPVTGYAAATGCACKAEEGSCQAVLSVEGLDVHIGLAESSGMIVFQTGVALLPPAGDGRYVLEMEVDLNQDMSGKDIPDFTLISASRTPVHMRV